MRDYDNQREFITTIYGTNDIVEDQNDIACEIIIELGDMDFWQDKMRNACIKSYNKFYDVDSRLKTKQKGRESFQAISTFHF